MTVNGLSFILVLWGASFLEKTMWYQSKNIEIHDYRSALNYKLF